MKFLKMLPVAAFSLCLVGDGSAQSFVSPRSFVSQSNDTKKSDTDPDAKTMTVTGCLAQGASANDFTIKDGGGMSYGLQPGGQNLKAHVGHKVTVSGIAMKGKPPHDDERIRVTNLTMISATCP
jgi:hypothetical protein